MRRASISTGIAQPVGGAAGVAEAEDRVGDRPQELGDRGRGLGLELRIAQDAGGMSRSSSAVTASSAPSTASRTASSPASRRSESGSCRAREARPPHAQPLAEQQRQSPPEGVLPGVVAVVGDHDLLGVAGEELRLLGGEGGAHAGDRAVEAGGDGADDVEVALAENGPAGLADRALRLVQAVEEVPLVEALGLVGVDVLGLVVAQRPPAEADQPARGVVDGEHQPVAEAVVGLAPLLGAGRRARPLRGPPGGCADGGAEQVAPAVRGVAEAEALDQLRRDAPLLQVLPGDGRLAELVGEELRRGLESALDVALGAPAAAVSAGWAAGCRSAWRAPRSPPGSRRPRSACGA